jgi:hypothetical protein
LLREEGTLAESPRWSPRASAGDHAPGVPPSDARRTPPMGHRHVRPHVELRDVWGRMLSAHEQRSVPPKSSVRGQLECPQPPFCAGLPLRMCMASTQAPKACSTQSERHPVLPASTCLVGRGEDLACELLERCGRRARRVATHRALDSPVVEGGVHLDICVRHARGEARS